LSEGVSKPSRKPIVYKLVVVVVVVVALSETLRFFLSSQIALELAATIYICGVIIWVWWIRDYAREYQAWKKSQPAAEPSQ
jgi:hypothetical protein